MLIIMVMAGAGLTSYFILPNAILSQIIDEDELITGYRREAIYFGVQGLLERIFSSFSGLVLGLWMSFYLIGKNILFISLLGVIGGFSIIITSIMFTKVPLKS